MYFRIIGACFALLPWAWFRILKFKHCHLFSLLLFHFIFVVFLLFDLLLLLLSLYIYLKLLSLIWNLIFYLNLYDIQLWYTSPPPYSTSLSPYAPNPTIFLPAPMMMISLFPVRTRTLIRWLRPFLPTHQLLRSRQISEVWPFLLQSPPSLYSPLNLSNLTPILKSLWTTPYYP